HQREHHQQPLFEQQSSSSLNTPERMDLSTSLSSENNFNNNNNKNFSPISSPDLRRQFSSLFWTPQQAKRIAERENSKNVPVVPIQQQQQNNREFIEDANHYANSSKEINNYNSLSRPSNKHTTTNSSGFGNGSTVTFYSIPISQKEAENKNLLKNEKEKNGKLELSNNNLNKQQQQNVHYSAIPFRRRIGGLLGSMSAISTPSLFHQREDEEDKPKSHYQNIDFNSDKNNKLMKKQQQFNRPSNLSNNKLNNTGTITTSQTTFPTNSNKLINETKHQQTNYNNNNINFPLHHLFRRNQTSEKQAFSTPNTANINSNNNNNSTQQQIRNRSVEATDLSSRNGLNKTLPLLPRRDSEPSIILFAAAESSPQQQQFSEQKEKHQISSSIQSPNNKDMKQENREENDKTTKIVSEDSSSLLSTTQSLESSSSCSASISASPLASSSSNISTIKNNINNLPQSRQRIKSPSLAALRQSLLRYRPLRKNSTSSNNSGNNNNEENVSAKTKGKLEETTSLTSTDTLSNSDSNEHSKQQKNFMSRSMFLTPSKLCLTKFATNNQNKNSKNKESSEKMDAVEEAIRSLEQFDPNEFVHYQYQQDAENNNKTQNQQQQQQIIAIQSTTPQPKLYIAKTEQPIYLSQPYCCSVTASPIVFEQPSHLSSLSSLPSAIEDQQFNNNKPLPPSLPSILHRGTSTNTAFSSSSGSATPTQTATNFVLDEPSSSSFNFSMDDNQNNNQFCMNNPPTNTTNTPRANSPTIEENDEATEEQNKVISEAPPRRGVTFNDNLVQHFYAPFDGPPPDYSESGGDSNDDLDDDIYNAEELPDDEIDALDSVTDSEEFYINNKIVPNSSSSSAALEAKAQLRKRFLCSQLNDCAKVIEIGALKMGQFVNVSLEIGGWRQPHILRHNLGAIRDTIYTVEIALDELVETLGRISLHRRDPRQEHLRLLFQPCEYSLTLLRRLRSSLDSTGWLLSTLARPRGNIVGHDALDQVVALLPQLPRDCAKLVQWVSSLSAWSDPQRPGQLPAVVFLPSSNTSKPQRQQNSNDGLFPLPHFPLYRQPSPTSSLQNFYYSSSGGEEEMREKNSKGLADIMDGGESTSSTTSSVQTTLEQTTPQKQLKQQQQQPEQIANERDNNIENTDLVLEEDDLASVLSIDSNTTTEGGQQHQLSPPNRHLYNTGVLSSKLGICRVNAELARSLAPEQRDLFRIWEPQVETHIDTICSIIEQFFVLLEENKEPTPAGFQKIQMVYIEGHSLVGIGRVICRDDVVLKHRPLNAFIEHECAKLDLLLNECLSNAKVAKSHTQTNNQNNNKNNQSSQQTVPAIRNMCKAVVSVSESVGHLRLFWRACCG
uniref:Serine rich protein interaction domain-containing protein n=1 Tax=Meloidogyne floridensis TaxID=298350 RepID=A0A915NL93_9BILA